MNDLLKEIFSTLEKVNEGLERPSANWEFKVRLLAVKAELLKAWSIYVGRK